MPIALCVHHQPEKLEPHRMGAWYCLNGRVAAKLQKILRSLAVGRRNWLKRRRAEIKEDQQKKSINGIKKKILKINWKIKGDGPTKELLLCPDLHVLNDV